MPQASYWASRVSKRFCRTSKIFGLSSVVSGSGHHCRLFSAMKEIKVKGGSNADPHLLNDEAHAPQLSCATQGCSASNVQCTPEIEKKTGFGDAAISIAVLHHLSTENRRKKAIEELLRVVKKGGLVLITVWAVEQEDKSLLTKWMPLSEKYVEEWVGPGSPRVRSPSSLALESIPEMNENNSGTCLKDSKVNFTGSMPENIPLPSQSGNDFANCNDENLWKTQQEYFVPWHLPYHRAEVSGTSAGALASGLAKKDDKKAAVVYNRYYHVFSEGELERLVSGMDNAVVVDRFYDKSNWCIVLEKTM
ncbi:alkylated DNA repair protein alkB homolog 8-like isoform X2 [Cucurbita pepo subsp. pepo]|uniref:alkylated DNA repair protein alkB homolog 8-like isoform X2 n=1 Tax=Cucurbita pepo subsp. pepo TaxID=3664 RepID=UPI000C9D8561|nr:alkylated DNA repair protein alkB homolog 8-like isoform X2 [Cucurbita pepo subsp. pepo]